MLDGCGIPEARRFKIRELDQVLPGHKLSNSGPNLLIFWDVLAPHKLEIWCAEISLERRKETCDIRGNIVWSLVVITLDPPPHHQHHCDLPVVIYHVPVADAMYDLITAVSVVCSFYNSFTNPSALSLEFICVR
ncbi:PREDICTED: putative F-box/kelch-repeat protein At3g24610 [Brassica oleracea var. oleracea]|uniref:putative F-box/kelch-repeat protein At3g24610 n=1 Tax=Brassica oleracea var. oleracea TaxID=109376 RepID=UPI0006A70F6B|nr:PREDICTED: putative F-box/kelch-repeat protein At3g24610 [Brassica oleracea var. oleracea]